MVTPVFSPEMNLPINPYPYSFVPSPLSPINPVAFACYSYFSSCTETIWPVLWRNQRERLSLTRSCSWLCWIGRLEKWGGLEGLEWFELVSGGCCQKMAFLLWIRIWLGGHCVFEIVERCWRLWLCKCWANLWLLWGSSHRGSYSSLDFFENASYYQGISL